LPPVITRGIQFADFLNNSKGGKGLDAKILSDILNYLEQNPDPNQVFIFLFGGNNLRDAKKGEKAIGDVTSRFQTILEAIKKIGARAIICGCVPDPLYPNLDYRFLDMDLALSSLDLGPLGTFLEIRTPVLNSQGFVRQDCYEPYGIHLCKFGQNVVGSKINKLLMQIVKSTQIQVQVPTPLTPAAVSIPHPREAELASLWLLVKGYPIPTPLQLQSLLSPSLPLPIPSPTSAELASNDQMETDAPVEVEKIDTPAPDYPETDDEDQATNNEPNTNAAAIVSNNQNELNSNVIPDPNLVRPSESEPSGSNLNSIQINSIQPALRPQRPAFFAGPTSSDTVQNIPVNQIEFIPTRASTPTPNIDMLDETSGSATSQVTLNASKLLADNDQSMVGANETIVEKMQKTALKPKLDDITEEEPEPGTSGSQIE
jgi:hypothetical protein